MNEKRIMIILLVVFCVIVSVILVNAWINYGLAEDDGYFILCKPKGTVNVRERPNTDAPVVGWVEFGRYVRTDGKEKNGFVHVVDLAAEVTEGWVYAGYLVYDQPRDEQYRAEVWGGRVIARECVGGKQLRVLKEGRQVTVYARSNAWAVTNLGYVMCDWLREVEP